MGETKKERRKEKYIMRLNQLLLTMSPTIKFMVVGKEYDEGYPTKVLFDNTIYSNTLLDFDGFINSIYGEYQVLSITYILEEHPFDSYLRIFVYNPSDDG